MAQRPPFPLAGMASLIKWDQPQVTKKGAVAAKKASGNSHVEELLDAIVPPKSYSTDDGSLWQQRISATPATKMDVTRLHESLDQLLLQKQARETGVCPVRESLYRETFGACQQRPPPPSPYLFRGLRRSPPPPTHVMSCP